MCTCACSCLIRGFSLHGLRHLQKGTLISSFPLEMPFIIETGLIWPKWNVLNWGFHDGSRNGSQELSCPVPPSDSMEPEWRVFPGIRAYRVVLFARLCPPRIRKPLSTHDPRLPPMPYAARLSEMNFVFLRYFICFIKILMLPYFV